MIFETHAHYDDEAFDNDRDSLISSMNENGIAYIVNVGADIESTCSSIGLAHKYPFIYAAAGVHPSDTGKLDDDSFNLLTQYANDERVVAIGEIGLDYYWDEPDRDTQKIWFVRQLELAKSLSKPVIIHSRDAAQDTYDIMVSSGAAKVGGIIHCYSYSPEMALDYVNMGFFIGIGGVVTFKNARKVREVVDKIPLERIVLETDSPYLSPEPNRGKRNCSLNLKYVADEIARIKGIDSNIVIEQTYRNAIGVYGLEV